MESLEDRRVMAAGPSLVSVIPNNGVFLRNQDTLTIAPRDITFRFAQGNAIDPASLASGVKLVRAGVDGVFDAPNAAVKNDIVVSPGFIGLGDTPREVVMRFAANLPDDLYRITLIGVQPTGTSAPPLRDTSGNPFTVNGVPANQDIDFNLDLGTKVEAIVPQPITRGPSGLVQSLNTIEVYFDSKELNTTEVRKPSFYRLIDAATGSISLPSSVSAPVIDAGTGHTKVTLTFAGSIPASTYKLEIGTTSEPNTNQNSTPDFKIAQAQHIGNSMPGALQAFLGDNITTLINPFPQGNDVDLYRFELESAVSDFSVSVTPGATLDAVVRIFDSAGNPIADAAALINAGTAGVIEAATGVSLAAGTYYVGVSSAGNASYSPSASGTGLAANGGSTGAYAIQVTFSDLLGGLDDTSTLNNSSYDTAIDVGTLGSAGRNLAASIAPTLDPLRLYDIQLPGAGDAPGERNIPFQQHILTVPGRLPDPTAGVKTLTYDFQAVYGFTPQGQQFFNSINEAQKQRAREVLELYGRYLGVQFQEVPDDVVADMTIATGDPRAVAPTISTGTGFAGTGVNGISGTPVVPSNADVTSNAALAKLLTSNTGAISNVGTRTLTNNEGFAVVVESANHGLRTGDYVRIAGVQGTTSSNGVWQITVVDKDIFALNGSTSNGPYTFGGAWTQLNISRGVAIQNALVNWSDPNLGGANNNLAALNYGGLYFQTAMHQIGHLLGLGDNFEAPALTIMGAGETPSQAANAATAERVFPGDADIVYGQTVQRPESRDIDLYKFVVTEPGLFRSETVAERLANPSLLNTQLTLYRETSIGGVSTRTQVAHNDDYYGNDSYLEVRVNPGTYYLSVSSTGMTEMDPTILDSGFGGRTQGSYTVSMNIKPDSSTTSLRDATSSTVAFDGDADGTPGGTYQFFFQSNTPAASSEIIYVNKVSTATAGALGSLANPYRNLQDALNKATQAASDPNKKIIVVRIVGNDADGLDRNAQGPSLADNTPYLVGFRDPARLQPLADGGEFNVPENVTVMIDAGAMFKMRRANLNAGTTPQGLVTKAGGAIQVLGTPNLSVRFTSYNDDTMGGDTNGPGVVPLGGDYGGIVYRDDADHERDFLAAAGSAANPLSLSIPVYLNYVNHAAMTYGGGKVAVDSLESTYDPIWVSNARPTISYNTITLSANAAISANPNAFDDDGLLPQLPFDQRRIGLDVHDNLLSVTTVLPPATPGGPSQTVVSNNSLNGLFVRIRTDAGVPLDFVDLPTRWDSTDIVYIVSENLEIAGTPGGSRSPGAGRLTTTLTDGRLRIDQGVLVKLSDARIETKISGQLIAEGTAAMPIIFTSVQDDKYGAGGTFDTNKDNSATAGAPGQWGGFVFGPASHGSLDQAGVFYGGGLSPVGGGFEDNFNAVEVHQADARIANSLFQFNAAGGGTTNRDGRGTNANATIFVRGAQPTIVNNTLRDNVGPVISVDASALKAVTSSDPGRSTGPVNRNAQFDGNYGPLVRGNRLSNNAINGMEVRGGVLTTETVWDDTDIVHVLRSEITVLNHQVFSGVRLQSSPTQSLVVKLQGATAGFTANGVPLDISDRIGGTVQIVGQPGRPVVLTSLADDSVSASLDPLGLPQFDTNNNGSVTSPLPGDWRSVKLEKLSNDTNVAQVIENESPQVGIAGQLDNSRTPQQAQFLGVLAKDLKSGDDTRRLGFQINGSIAYDYAADVDVYSFEAESGTEVWIDIDRTSYGLDAMVELVDISGNVVARATNTMPVAPLFNATDPGLNPNVPGGLARTFNKDPFQGRDTYSTNSSASVVTSTGVITNVLGGFPIRIASANHGLVTGDRVVINGVTGNLAANGTFTVTRIDDGTFSLDGALSSGTYAGGGAWARLVQATRDPIMRLTLPTGAGGQVLEGPWFVRVRSEPKTLEGANTGNAVSPGQTSGAYQLQVRLSQKDQKPGSTVRFADLRYANNAIEVHGLPSNSPLAGTTGEADSTANDTFAGAQNLGNLLRTDKGTISVGGQLSAAGDVDWYRFDLNFDLLQFVNGYTNGFKTWSTIFDLDYGDASVGGDFTISVFDSQGRLMFTGRDSDVQDDQGQQTSALASGSFGTHDPFIGPVQMPATVPGQSMTYFVAVHSDRTLPQVLDQTFNPTATVSTARVEPIEAVARVAFDPMEVSFRGTWTGGQTAEAPSNIYFDGGQPNSTLVDATDLKSLKANVRPFFLADAPMFISTVDRLFNVDPTLGEAKAVALEDFDTLSPVAATAQTDFGSGGAASGGASAIFTASQAGPGGNGITLNFSQQDRGGQPPAITVNSTAVPPSIDIVLDTNAGTSGVGTTVGQLLTALQNSNAASALVTMSATGNLGFDLGNNPNGVFYSPIILNGGGDTGAPLQVLFAADASGPAGNNIVINFTRQDNIGPIGPQVNVTPGTNTINIFLDKRLGPNGRGTTLGQLITAINNSAAGGLIDVVVVSGSLLADIANPTDPNAPTQFTLFPAGGSQATDSVETTYNPRVPTANVNQMADVTFRADGVMFGYESVNQAGVNNTAGRLTIVDTGTGTSTTVGNDNIQDLPAQAPNPLTVAYHNAINSNLSGNAPAQAAMAWGGSPVNGINNMLLYYAIPDDVNDASRLYRADPTNGSANLAANQPWGRVGVVGGPNNSGVLIGNNGLITSATPATGQTDFQLPGSPVIVSLRTTEVGAAAGGSITFQNANLGAGNPPQVVVNNASPVDMTVTMNVDEKQAEVTATFSSQANSVNFLFTAGPQFRGSAGNQLFITLTRANRNGQGPTVNLIGTNQIAVTLDTGQAPGAPAPGTTAQQLFDAFQAFDNNPATGGIIFASFTGPGDTIVSNTPLTQLRLATGADATTAQQVVNAINAAFAPNVGQVVQANVSSGPGNTVVAQPNPPFTVQLTGGSGTVGITTGLTFGTNGQLFGVTDQGQFLRNISLSNAVPQSSVPVTIPNPSTPGTTLSGSQLRFAGLSRGPQNVWGGPDNVPGYYANMFFAITDSGILVALDSSGVPQQIFDTDGDGDADSSAIQTGVSGGGVTGITFSPFDFNLWHPTYRRQNDPGHGIGLSPTNTTRDSTLAFPSSGRHQDDNLSFNFGFEQWVQNPGVTSNTYLTYPATAGVPANGGQLGVLLGNDTRGLGSHRELSTNGAFNNNYNLPGGAYGSLMTDKFSLAGLEETDKPTFYFDYFLETEDANAFIQEPREMRDSARVYIGPFERFDSGGRRYVTWDLLATNNDRQDSPGSGVIDAERPTFTSASASAFPANPRQQVQVLHDNTAQWRQARVDLSRYAGQSNLQLRFDFTTAGQMPTPRGHLPPNNFQTVFPPTTVFAPPGTEFLWEDSFGDLTAADRGQNNDHEGFFIDNIIIGAAERGEMAIEAPANTNFFTTPTPQNLHGGIAVPTQVLTGAYQLEIRRGAEYGVSDGGPLGGINANNAQTPVIVINTNERLIADQRPADPIPVEDLELGTFALPWNFTDDAPWVVTSAQANSGTFSAASGIIEDGESSGLSIDLMTGNGDLTFARSTASEAGFDVLRLWIDGRLATYTAIDGVPLATPQLAQWSGTTPFETITVPVSAGHHNFRWTYDKDASLSGGQDRVFLDDIRFPTPQRGMGNIYEDVQMHDAGDPNSVTPPIPPTIPPPTSFAQVAHIDTLYPGMVRIGDENLDRPQGHVLIEQNQIDSALNAGVLIDAGPREAGTNNPYAAARTLPTLNNERLVPGVTVSSNIISNFGQSGVSFAGDANAGGAQDLAAVPYARILNNTIYGGLSANGTGINVGLNAGGAIMNNIVANTVTAISVDPTSTATTDLSFNLFSGNTANGVSITNTDIVLAPGEPLFRDPAKRNFYLAQGSRAVDSAREATNERSSIAAVKSAVGIPASNIVAPARDVFGQVRFDDSTTPNTGAGEQPFFDRGAVERVDFERPTASISDPLDNDSFRRDRNPLVDEVAIRNEDLELFAIRLSDFGIGINHDTVTADQFLIFVDASTTPLVLGTDYTFVYNKATQEAVFRPTSGLWAREHTYTIKVRNVEEGQLDPLGNPIPPGVRDLAGNPIAANRLNGETSFFIFVGTLYDFGDAPDTYSTLLASNGPAHEVLDGFHIGAGVSEEREAKVSTDANLDDFDDSDGINIKLLRPGVPSLIEVTASIPDGMVGYFNAWIDLNKDGNFLDAQGGIDPGEKVIEHVPLQNGLTPVTFTFGTFNTEKGEFIARFRFSSGDESRQPTGIAPDGEVIDRKVRITGPEFQNPNNIYDVNNSAPLFPGVDPVSPADALTIINFLNAWRPIVSPNNISLPPQPPLPMIQPEGGGPGRALYMDVTGDTFLAPDDAQAVINYINSRRQQASGEGEGQGEGESNAFAPAYATSTASYTTPVDASLPPVLFASSSVVIEERSAPDQGTMGRGTIAQGTNLDYLASNQSQLSAEELALLALSASSSSAQTLTLAEASKLKVPGGPLDEASWEELLNSLAADQKEL